MAALLVPWTLYLAVTLPRHYPAHHYWLGWVGFDLALVAVLAMTGMSLARGGPALRRYAATAATLLVVDAWFDVLNAATATDVLVSVLAAGFIELPLACLCWRLARGDWSAGSQDRDLRPVYLDTPRGIVESSIGGTRMTANVETPGIQASTLPLWSAALVVVAHPDDESFALGAVLDALVRSGCSVSVLCLTRGEASTVHGISGDLRALRAMELRDAAAALGLTSAELGGHPDGALARVPQDTLVDEVVHAARRAGAEGLVVFDPSGITGHPDHVAASHAALAAAIDLDLPVLGWTLPDRVAQRLNDEFATTFIGHPPEQIDLAVPVSRDKQRTASLAHASQAVPTSVLWRRLELLGDVEHLRWLHGGDAVGTRSASPSTQATPAPADVASMRVDYYDGDRFEISIRDHVVTVDQPTDIGGDDLGPTPTELFVAGLASCVAFYARRYLRRHKLDACGLRVETSYRMAAKPTRVSQVELRICLPLELPFERREGLLAAAGHCTVHNSISTAPEISIAL